jgi:phage gpG-like protein
MSDLELTVNAREVDRLFDAMERRGKSPGAAFRKIRPHMQRDQREHAQRREGPEAKWAQRAPSTLAKFKRGKTGRRLVRRPMGKLPGAVTYSASDKGVFGRSRVRWSGAHQEGARIARGNVLPARPFLWISDGLRRIAARLLADFTAGGR